MAGASKLKEVASLEKLEIIAAKQGEGAAQLPNLKAAKYQT